MIREDFVTSTIKLSIMIPVYNQEDLVFIALESIPRRKDIELVIVDDHSTDNTPSIIKNWLDKNQDKFGNIIVNWKDKNEGVGCAKRWAYQHVTGEYVITLDSDDYYYTDEFNSLVDRLYDTNSDMIFIDNDINSGERWGGTFLRCATWSYFCRVQFLVDTKLLTEYSAIRRAGDFKLKERLEKHNPKVEVWNVLAYHYNYPREGSISWNWDKYRKL